MSTWAEAMKNSNFKFYKTNICDRKAIYEIFENEHSDIVVNFAAESHVDRSIENPKVFLQTNILGTQMMMDACHKYGITRYHQVSKDEVYGDLSLDRPDLLFTEETLIHTSSPYSASKASADLLVQAYHRTFGLPVTISRCSDNYGPYHFPEKLIPLMIANALNDKPLPVYGEGLNVRDWLYVEDHCKAIDLIIHNGKIGEVYNIGGHNVMNELHKCRYEAVGINKADVYSGVADNFAVTKLRYVSLDITDADKVEQTITGIKPDVVIHCAAWTAVNMAEDDDKVDFVRAVNAGGTQNIANACKNLDCKMIYISTDYVFNGQGTESWQPDYKDYAPLNVYGKTKLEGEFAVANTLDLARLLVDMVETDKYGYYHATNEGGYICWYDFTCEIFQQAGYTTKVVPLTTEEYGLSKANRPFNSRLDKSKLVENGFKPLPIWQEAVSRYFTEIGE